MLEEFIRYWWLALVRGLLLTAFGMLALLFANNVSFAFAEALVRVTLVVLFAIYLGLSGSLTILTAILIRHASHRWMYIAHGVLLATVCLVIILSPQVHLETLVLLTIAHAVINGLGEARMSSAFRHHRGEMIILAVMAAASLAAAVALALFNHHDVANTIGALGAYSLFYGLCLIYFGWHLRRKRAA